MLERSSLRAFTEERHHTCSVESSAAKGTTEVVLKEAAVPSVRAGLSFTQIDIADELRLADEMIDLTVTLFHPNLVTIGSRLAEALCISMLEKGKDMQELSGSIVEVPVELTSRRTSSVDADLDVQISKSNSEEVVISRALGSTSIVQPFVHGETIAELDKYPAIGDSHAVVGISKEESCVLSVGQKVPLETSATISCEFAPLTVRFAKADATVFAEVAVSREQFDAETGKGESQAATSMQIDNAESVRSAEFGLPMRESMKIQQKIYAPEMMRFQSFDEICQTEEMCRPICSAEVAVALGKLTFVTHATDTSSRQIVLSKSLCCAEDLKQAAAECCWHAASTKAEMALSVETEDCIFESTSLEEHGSATVAGEVPSEAVSTTVTSQKQEQPEVAVHETIAVEAQLGEAPGFVLPLSSLSVAEGSFVRLKCIVTGKPAPAVHWYVDGDRISSSKDFKIAYEDGVTVLEIKEVYPEDEGEYSCEATNMLGTAWTSAYLTIARDTDGLCISD